MYTTERHEIKQILQPNPEDEADADADHQQESRPDEGESRPDGQESRRGGRVYPCHWKGKKAEKGQRILVDIALKCVLF